MCKWNNCKQNKRKNGGFLGMLLGILCANLLGNLLKSKGVIRAVEGTTATRPGTTKRGKNS